MAIEFFLAAIEQFLPLAEQAVGHGGEGLFVFQVVFKPGAEGAFADVVREAAVFLAGFAVEQALHLLVQGFVIATGLLQGLAGNKAGGLARLVLAGEGSAQVFDGHGVQLLWLILVGRDCAMVWVFVHRPVLAWGAGRGVVVYFSLEKQLASLRHLFPAEK